MTTKLFGAANDRRSLETSQDELPQKYPPVSRPNVKVAVYCDNRAGKNEARTLEELELCGRFVDRHFGRATTEQVVDVGRGQEKLRQLFERAFYRQVDVLVVKNLRILNRYPARGAKIFALLFASGVRLYAIESGGEVNIQHALIQAWGFADSWKHRCRAIAAKRREMKR